jgi:hypothetical protein
MKKRLSAAVAVMALVSPFSLGAFDMAGAVDAASKSAAPAAQQSGTLIDSLTKSLGVTPSQAAGGTAALLNKAKEGMGEEQFSKLLSGVPDLSSLMENTGGLGSMLGGANVSSLADQFAALGLDSEMIGKFTSQLLEYVQSEGGTEMMNLLKGAL